MCALWAMYSHKGLIFNLMQFLKSCLLIWAFQTKQDRKTSYLQSETRQKPITPDITRWAHPQQFNGIERKQTWLTITNDSISIDKSAGRRHDNLQGQTTTGNILSLQWNSTVKLSYFNNQGHLSCPVSEGYDRQVKLPVLFRRRKRGFLLRRADFSFFFLLFPQTTQHKVAQGEVHFAQQDILWGHIFFGWCHILILCK